LSVLVGREGDERSGALPGVGIDEEEAQDLAYADLFRFVGHALHLVLQIVPKHQAPAGGCVHLMGARGAVSSSRMIQLRPCTRNPYLAQVLREAEALGPLPLGARVVAALTEGEAGFRQVGRG
jgi:hypothetical protein